MSPALNPPKLIALCGNPLSGKSTAAELFGELFGHALVDDGRPMREMAIAHFGASHDDVYTQAGKLRTTEINGQTMTWRDVLGRLGNGLEAQFGADVIPELAINGLDLANGRFVTGSVRREQGFYYRKRGALVIEILSASAGPSPYEFDRYNPAAAHVRVRNNWLAMGFTPEEARREFKNALALAVKISPAGRS